MYIKVVIKGNIYGDTTPQCLQLQANAHNNSIIDMPQIDVKKVEGIEPNGNLSREV